MHETSPTAALRHLRELQILKVVLSGGLVILHQLVVGKQLLDLLRKMLRVDRIAITVKIGGMPLADTAAGGDHSTHGRHLLMQFGQHGKER